MAVDLIFFASCDVMLTS